MLSPCAAGQLVQDVNSLKKRAPACWYPPCTKPPNVPASQVYNIESSLVLYPSGRLFAQAIVTRSR
ncbi:hypothetical protein [Serratia symbiotica]|uniref:DUF7609 family protein n=1 Tax=Serratia symbiotica TaxID=138074 RepID=UPI003CD0CF62